MNDGNTSGSGASTRHTGASGRSVRVNNHAIVTPITSAAVVTRTASCTVRHAGASDSASTSPRSPPRVSGPPGDVEHRGGERGGDDERRRGAGRRLPARVRRGNRVIGAAARTPSRRELGRRDRGDVGTSAFEPGVTDHLAGRLEVGAEVVEVEVDVARRGEVDVGQDLGRLDAVGQRVLERLVGEVALRLLAEEELDERFGARRRARRRPAPTPP